MNGQNGPPVQPPVAVGNASRSEHALKKASARELQQKLNRVKLSLASVRAPVPPTVGVEIAHKTASSRGGAAVTSTSLKFACKPVVVVQRKLPALVLNQEKVRII